MSRLALRRLSDMSLLLFAKVRNYELVDCPCHLRWNATKRWLLWMVVADVAGKCKLPSIGIKTILVHWNVILAGCQVCWSLCIEKWYGNSFSDAMATESSDVGSTMESVEFNCALTIQTIKCRWKHDDRWRVDCLLMWVQWASSLWSLRSHCVIKPFKELSHAKPLFLDRIVNRFGRCNHVHQLPI